MLTKSNFFPTETAFKLHNLELRIAAQDAHAARLSDELVRVRAGAKSLEHEIMRARATQAKAEHANRGKDDFLAMVSHELRTPLAVMLMQAKRLPLLRDDSDKLVLAGQKIERGIQTLVHLVDDLLDVSRIIAGKMEMPCEPVNLVEVVTAAVDGVAAPVERKALKLTLVCDEALVVVHGNASRLQQVASNLLTNAVKFTPAHGTILVSLRQTHEQVFLEVVDTGCGINPEFLPHVFERFAQEDSSVTRTHGGLGLGLAIALHLVELHGGSLRAESAGLGTGSTFTVSLPLSTRKP